MAFHRDDWTIADVCIVLQSNLDISNSKGIMK